MNPYGTIRNRNVPHMKSKRQIIFFGTPEFAVPALNALHALDFCAIKLVVTQPDKPVGRHHSRLVPCPVKKAANVLGVKVVTPRHPERSETPYPAANEAEGYNMKILESADIGILVAYGKIIPQNLLSAFPLGILNIHPSLLPRYRGSSPIQAAILNQDDATGVTLMKLDDAMDHGPIVAQERIKLRHTETAGELHDILAEAGARLLINALPDYLAGKINLQEQDHKEATYTKKLSKEDGRIGWSKPSDEIEAHVRAMNPWPGAWTMWKNKKLIVWKASLHNGENRLQIEEMQIEGKKRLGFDEFKRGHPDFDSSDCA